MAPSLKNIIIGIAALLIGALSVYFTHPFWCTCDSISNKAVVNSFILPESHAEIVLGKPLDDHDRTVLATSRKKNNANNAEIILYDSGYTPQIVKLTPADKDRSYKVDTSIAWVDTTAHDSGFYHIVHYSDCLFGRDVNLSIESTPRHIAPPMSEGRRPLITGETIEALSSLYSFLKLSAFVEHDFARNNFTIGVRARIDIWKIGAYGAAAIGAANLPVGIDYTFWKK